MTPDERYELQETIRHLQGNRCIIPWCTDNWEDLAHLEPSGSGGRDNAVVGNLVGMCRPCHDRMDGRDLKGRDREYRRFVAHYSNEHRSVRAMLRGESFPQQLAHPEG